MTDKMWPPAPGNVEWKLSQRGGKREGSGRKALDPQGTIVTTIRLTAEQRATLDLLGGGEWLRAQLQHVIEGNGKPSSLESR